ncbi:MAG: VWA domain-containing protein [Phycisphaerae bacterium]|nr:VWA domain-containing protein [Phycisphaerae bacterium]
MSLSQTRNRSSAQRRGSALVQTALFGTFVGLGCAAIAIDSGLLFNARAELQRAADASALAAAAQLVSGSSALSAAREEAARFAALNRVQGLAPYVNGDQDVVFGHAALNGTRYEFQPNVQPYDAVQVTVKRDGSDSLHPGIDLTFAQAIFLGDAEVQATATAMLVPRDIAIVIDLSGSMNDDSELRHYREYTSEVQGTSRPGVQVNLEDVWLALPCTKGNNGVGNGVDPQPPGNPGNQNDQPGTGPGSPNSQGGNPSPGADPSGGGNSCGGPRWGWMSGFGSTIVLGSYTPVGDPGLYYIPRYATCSDADVIENLTTAGYSAAERSALLSSAYDGTFTYYTNRVKVLLGLAGWRSKKQDSKYSGGPGNGDNRVDTNELTQQASWPFAGGSWSDYISYVSGSSQMTATDSNFRYRYGIKTVVNYLLEKQARASGCPELAAAPELPLKSAKDAVQTMIDLIISLDSDDHCSLEVFATTGRHEVNLTVPGGGQSLAAALQTIPDTLYQRQAGHYDSTTNIGAGLHKAITELTSNRARSTAAKVVILLTDGKPNVGENGLSPEDYAIDRAHAAANLGMTLYTIGVGADVDPELLQQIADIGDGEYFYADSTPDENGQPMYVTQLHEIFERLGSERPVRLID